MSSLKSRLSGAAGASLAQQAVAIAIQLASVPLLIGAWGLAPYGQWLVLSAAPTYLSLADFGFTASAGNNMTMALARGDTKSAQVTLSASLRLSIAAILVFAAAAIGASRTLPISSLFAVTSFTESEAALILSCLSLIALLSMFRTTIFMVLFADGRYPLGGTLLTACRAFEFVVLVATALSLHSPEYSVIAQVAASLLATVGFYCYVACTTKWAHLSSRYCRWSDVQLLLGPSISFMAFPLAFALNIQGVTIFVGREFPAAAVVAFTTTRTLTRFMSLPFRQFVEASRSEFPRAYGTGDLALLTRLVQASARLAIWFGLPLTLGLISIAPYILHAWTRNHVSVELSVIAPLAAVAYIQVVGCAGYAALYSCNAQRSLATAYVGTNTLLLMSLVLIRPDRLGLVADVVLLAEMALLAWTLLLTAQLLEVRPDRLIRASLQVPRDEFRILLETAQTFTRAIGDRMFAK